MDKFGKNKFGDTGTWGALDHHFCALADRSP